jgi:D-lyxose ketol-isomerase
MINREEYESAVKKALEYLQKAGIVITPDEVQKLEVADFGLNELEKSGLEIITYINTDRCCAKELILFPHQTCPEHLHPPVDGDPGKEETFRCRWGTVYLYVPGDTEPSPACKPPAGSEPYYRVKHQVTLNPGEQYTINPGTPHWFQGGDHGAIVSEFSTKSRDEADIFTDPHIARLPIIEGIENQ